MFGALNKCVSPQGKRLLRLWFLRPIVNLAVLNDRLDGIHFFVQWPDAIKALRWVLGALCHAGRAVPCWARCAVGAAGRLLSDRLRGSQLPTGLPGER